LTLLHALNRLRRFYPVKFNIKAVTLTLGIGEFDLTQVIEYTKQNNIEYIIEETLIGKIVFDIRNEKNPCSMCANLRRGALNNTAVKIGCNKVALAHNSDDVIETLLLSMFYEGRIHTFSPVTYLDRKDLYVIRPLIYAAEKEIMKFIKLFQVSPVKNPCTVNGNTKRQFIKDLISNMEKETHDIKSNIFGAIKRAQIDKW
jgi:tRNA 2-thiocytidine biosynthesis protein TtcA